MSSKKLDFKPVVNVTRRTWDKETYEKKAKARAEAEENGATKRKLPNETPPEEEEQKEEFQPALKGSAGPEGSDRAFLKARQSKVDLESKVGTTEMVSAESAATAAASDGVVKTGVGWHCKVCDCFLKDSHTYLDHINGRKHQRKLGFSMRVERSTKSQLQDRLKHLVQEQKKKPDEEEEVDFDVMVQAKDEALQKQREERRRQRKERKKQLAEQKSAPPDEEADEEVEVEGIDPDMAAMMGFSGFGGSAKNG